MSQKGKRSKRAKRHTAIRRARRSLNRAIDFFTGASTRRLAAIGDHAPVRSMIREHVNDPDNA